MVATAFSDEQFHLAYPEGVEDHFWTLARNSIVHRLVVEDGPSDPVVLDVGCGRGLTVAALRRAGLECWGVEAADAPVAADLRPFVFSPRDAFALPEELRSRVDVVLLLDVVEHLPTPSAFLADCVRHFPRLALLVVTVPARRELWSNYDDFFGHFARYDRSSLLALLAPLGPRRVEVGYFFHLLYAVLRVQLFLGGARPVRHRRPTAPRLHWLLGRLFAFEQRLLPRSWYGSSLWARAQLGGRLHPGPEFAARGGSIPA